MLGYKNGMKQLLYFVLLLLCVLYNCCLHSLLSKRRLLLWQKSYHDQLICSPPDQTPLTQLNARSQISDSDVIHTLHPHMLHTQTHTHTHIHTAHTHTHTHTHTHYTHYTHTHHRQGSSLEKEVIWWTAHFASSATSSPPKTELSQYAEDLFSPTTSFVSQQ